MPRLGQAYSLGWRVDELLELRSGRIGAAREAVERCVDVVPVLPIMVKTHSVIPLAEIGVDGRRGQHRCWLMWAPAPALPATADPDERAEWFEDLPHAGIEGLVIKGNGQPPSAPGVRSWLAEIQARETVEIICGAVIWRLRPRGIRFLPFLPVHGRIAGILGAALIANPTDGFALPGVALPGFIIVDGFL